MVIVNSSRDKIERFALRFWKDANVVPFSEGLEVDEFVFLAKASPSSEELDFLQYRVNSIHSIVTSDGQILTERTDVKRFIQIMRRRKAAAAIRENEAKELRMSVPPKYILIEPVEICNLKCPHCETGLRESIRDNRRMDVSVALKVIQETQGMTENLSLPMQGEPFLAPEATFKIIREAKKMFMSVAVLTNGHWFSKDVIDGILSHNIDSICVTIDGASQESFSKYRVNGNLQKVLDGLKALVDARTAAGTVGPHIAIQMIPMKHNEHEIDRLSSIVEEIGVDSFRLLPMFVLDWGVKEEWLPKNEELRRSRYSYPNKNDYQEKHNKIHQCNNAWESLVVNTDGKIITCCYDTKSEWPKGSVVENSLMDVWNSEEYQAFRKNLRTGINEDPMCKERCAVDFDLADNEFIRIVNFPSQSR